MACNPRMRSLRSSPGRCACAAEHLPADCRRARFASSCRCTFLNISGQSTWRGSTQRASLDIASRLARCVEIALARAGALLRRGEEVVHAHGKTLIAFHLELAGHKGV